MSESIINVFIVFGIFSWCFVYTEKPKRPRRSKKLMIFRSGRCLNLKNNTLDYFCIIIAVVAGFKPFLHNPPLIIQKSQNNQASLSAFKPQPLSIPPLVDNMKMFIDPPYLPLIIRIFAVYKCCHTTGERRNHDDKTLKKRNAPPY